MLSGISRHSVNMYKSILKTKQGRQYVSRYKRPNLVGQLCEFVCCAEKLVDVYMDCGCHLLGPNPDHLAYWSTRFVTKPSNAKYSLYVGDGEYCRC